MANFVLCYCFYSFYVEGFSKTALRYGDDIVIYESRIVKPGLGISSRFRSLVFKLVAVVDKPDLNVWPIVVILPST